MSTNDSSLIPPPLSPAIEALLAHERVIVEKPEMVRARLLAAARESLRTAEAAAIGSAAMSSTAPARMRRVLLAAAAGVALMASVAAAYQMLWRPAPTTPASTRPQRPAPLKPMDSPSPEPSSAPAPAATPAPGPAAVLAPKTSAFGHRADLPRNDADAVGELRLLERARQSDARGDYASVLTIANDHEHRYPSGRLAEEREVLRVKALVGLGRGSEARSTATRFRRQFPRSVLLPTIEGMLSSLGAGRQSL